VTENTRWVQPNDEGSLLVSASRDNLFDEYVEPFVVQFLSSVGLL